jgi:cation:H+ antiporter
LTFPDFQANLIWANLAIFAAAASVIWFAGTKLARCADLIAERTGLGKAFVGLVLLAAATSLPEVATTATAAALGSASLAVNNLYGGIATQTVFLALADISAVRGSLTYFTPRPVLLLQGTALVLLLALALAGIAVGGLFSLFGIGLWTVVLFVAYLVAVLLIHRYEGRGGWKPVDVPDKQGEEGGQDQTQPERKEGEEETPSTRRVFFVFAALGLVILVAGVVIAQVAEALAEQTGLGAGFVGATLLATAGSLPELSTTIAAVRIGSYAMAVSNIFGSNAMDATLVGLADVFYREGPILQAVDRSSTFMAAVAIILTCVYLVGMIERRDRVIWRMGLDSALVLPLYLGALGILYFLR